MTDFTINYQVRFTISTEFGAYSDALYLSEDEYAAYKGKALEQMAQARADAWVENLKNPVVVEPTKEDLQATAAGLDQHIEELQAEKKRLATEIGKKG